MGERKCEGERVWGRESVGEVERVWGRERVQGGRECRENKSLPHHKVIGTRALLSLKWFVWG